MDTNLLEQLAEPFEVSEVKFKAQVVRGNRALAVAYVDARVVEDRLDKVFGVGGWQDAYTVLPNGSVMCVLRVKIGDEWIEKSDVGSISEQPDEGDRLKAAFSDALKRAAVKLGIGRYLYRLPQQWCDYDANSRQIKQSPKLPEWAYPKGAKKPKAPASQPSQLPAAPKVEQNGNGHTKGDAYEGDKSPNLTAKEWKEICEAAAQHTELDRKSFQAELLEHYGAKDLKPSTIPGVLHLEMLEMATMPTVQFAARVKKRMAT